MYKPHIIKIKDIITSSEFKQSDKILKFVIGKTFDGEKVIESLADAKHLLVAGSSGSGKSMFINVLLMSLMKESPNDVRFILIDTKKVELDPYRDIPHLLAPVINDSEQALSVLSWVNRESEVRYKKLQLVSREFGMSFRNIVGLNSYLDKLALGYKIGVDPNTGMEQIENIIKGEAFIKKYSLSENEDERQMAEDVRKTFDETFKAKREQIAEAGKTKEFNEISQRYEDLKLPHIVVVIDELAGLIRRGGKDVVKQIVTIAQEGRAAGIHLVVATQLPKADVITSEIKVNLQNKIVFQVSNHSESTVALGRTGAEKLLGKGDMYFKQEDDVQPKRIQGAFISDEEVDRITNNIRSNNAPPVFDESLINMLSENRNRNTPLPCYVPLIEEVYKKIDLASSSKDKTKDDDIDFIYVMDNFIDKDSK